MRLQIISIHAPPRGATVFVLLYSWQEIFQFTPLREGRPTTARACSSPIYFNSRPSARGDSVNEKKPPLEKFQFTPLREGRRDGRARGEADCDYFNSRPSARGDVETDTIVAQWFISIHAPPRGATKTSTGLIIQSKFQFTPLREGRQNIGVKPSVPNFISIHAPPRGATEQRRTRAATTTISIHAPPRGATREIHQRLGTLPISIHAPPRGATFCGWVAKK